MIDFDVDFVFPYVDCSREQWRKQYVDTCNALGYYNRAKAAISERYRDFGFLKYLFRGIAKYMPFIRKVFFLVQSEDQVPEWIDRNTVTIVTHEQFIPSAYLPTYNSTTIEMFLWNIPGLSEHFIYGNDDIFPLKTTTKEDYFAENGNLKIRYKPRSSTSGQFSMVCKHTFETVVSTFSNVGVGMYYFTPCHELVPMKKSHCLWVYTRLEPQIKRAISPFRAEKNFNQYLYSIYELVTDNTTVPERTYIYTIMGDKMEMVAQEITNANYNCLILNDNAETNIEHWQNDKLVINAFNKRFPRLCKYEVQK